MTNGEKYKTFEERKKAFLDFCKLRSCYECPLERNDTTANTCSLFWIEQEAEKSSKEMIKELAGSVNKELYGFRPDEGELFDKEVQAIIKRRDAIKAIWAKQDEETAYD